MADILITDPYVIAQRVGVLEEAMRDVQARLEAFAVVLQLETDGAANRDPAVHRSADHAGTEGQSGSPST